MIRPGPGDFLTLMTSNALGGVLSDARKNGRILPRIVFGTGCGSVWSIPRRFEDFLAAAVNAHRQSDARWELFKKMGFDFYNVASTFATMSEAQPHLLTSENTSWDSTVYVLLRSAGPKFVVVVDQIGAVASGQDDRREGPSISAVGVHPAAIVGFTATCCLDHRLGLVSGPIRASNSGAAQSRGREILLRVFLPGTN
jgi:hypothetical protein